MLYRVLHMQRLFPWNYKVVVAYTRVYARVKCKLLINSGNKRAFLRYYILLNEKLYTWVS